MEQGHVTIEVQRLEKHFGDFVAVNGINFEVRSGEIFGFLGPNGSGKTTTIRMMLGLLPPTEGNVRVLEIPVRDHPEAIRSRVGYMSQHFSLYNDLTVEQNLRFYGTAYGLSNVELDDRLEAAVALAGLSGRERERAETLSGGWRQRLALSAAILHKPQVLFLDEPTAGVDPVSRREFWELLYKLVEDNVTIFVTTHYMDEAEHCHRVAFIQRGEIIAVGSPRELRDSMMEGQIYEIVPLDAPRAIEVLRDAAEAGRLPAQQIELYGNSIHVVMSGERDPNLELRDLLERSGVRTKSMRVIEPSLEDVFITCMR